MPTYIVIIFFSFVSSLFALTVKENRRNLFFFPLFLLVTFFVEYNGWKQSVAGKNTVVMYNSFMLAEFIFYLIFLRNVTGRFYKKLDIASVLIVVYLVLACINVFSGQGLQTFNTYTYTLGCLFIVGLSIVYFNSLFRFTRTGTLAAEPAFWIVTGLLFYYTCSLSIFGITNFITKLPNNIRSLLIFMISFMNIALYLLFTIGFLCKINFRKLLRLS